ncbi:MAG: hypothetical protein GXP02_05910, partial [Alphaproteobacteria bacterium]|nr:hypothetical protein [Alphaproteobacteria bacterium]
MKFALEQLKLLSLDRLRPIIISDADEVILQFAGMLEQYLLSRGMYANFTSYTLEGNIKYCHDNIPVDPALFGEILNDYFDHYVEKMPVAAGAVSHLKNLSALCDIIILSNIPHHFADRRRQKLIALGFPYPMISNSGPKGPLMKAIRALTTEKLIFIDDISHHHRSVARAVPDALRIQYIADRHLDSIEQKSPYCHVRGRNWNHIEQVIR